MDRGFVNRGVFIVLLFVLVSAGTKATAQTANSSVPSSRPLTAVATAVDKFMQELYRRGEFNGAVLVAGTEGIIYRGAFGLGNRVSKVAFTPDTPSCLASVSKPLTALAVMMLAEKGSVRYDDHISEYIPELPAQLGVATVRQLLTHTSGIPDYSDLNVEHPGMSNAEVLKALTHVDHLDFPAGQKYQYSNSGYVLLSILVERVSGTPLSEYLQKKVFGPLRMTKSFVLTDDKEKTPDVARAYSAFGTPDDYQALSPETEVFTRQLTTFICLTEPYTPTNSYTSQH